MNEIDATIARLRSLIMPGYPLWDEVAKVLDEIERLRAERDEATYLLDRYMREHKAKADKREAEIERLRAALDEIASQADGHKRSTLYTDGINVALANIEAIARAALKGDK